MGTFDETSLFVLYLSFCVWRNLNAKKKVKSIWANSPYVDDRKVEKNKVNSIWVK